MKNKNKQFFSDTEISKNDQAEPLLDLEESASTARSSLQSGRYTNSSWEYDVTEEDLKMMMVHREKHLKEKKDKE